MVTVAKHELLDTFRRCGQVLTQSTCSGVSGDAGCPELLFTVFHFALTSPTSSIRLSGSRRTPATSNHEVPMETAKPSLQSSGRWPAVQHSKAKEKKKVDLHPARPWALRHLCQLDSRSDSPTQTSRIIPRLTAAGISLVDYSDLPLVRCLVDRTTNQAPTLKG